MSLKTKITKIALILLTAYQSRATDVHFEPQEQNSVVRQRIDGILYPLVSFDLTDHPKIIATIKDISGLKLKKLKSSRRKNKAYFTG